MLNMEVFNELNIFLKSKKYPKYKGVDLELKIKWLIKVFKEPKDRAFLIRLLMELGEQ